MPKARLAMFSFFFAALLAAQNAPAPPRPAAPPAPDYSGMYSFLQEGEFVQVSVEDAGKVTGFVSRYGESDNERGAFLDQFFKEGKLDGNKLSFTTQTVHGTWFEFHGTVERGPGKNPGDEAYFVLKGTLVQNNTDGAGKPSAKNREVTFKSFPQDIGGAPAKP